MAERCELQTVVGQTGVLVRRDWFSSQSEISHLRTALSDAAARATRLSIVMREADHRIKNNLQIIASFTRRVARQQQPSSASVHAIAVRIDEIANLHDLLQISPAGDVVDLGALLHRLRRSLETIIDGEPRRIELFLAAGPIMAPASLAQPIAMVVSELVMNAIRHAFPDGRRGTVRISAGEAAGSLYVVVADDGVGLPPGLPDAPGFGTELVRAMVGQIGGTLVAENDKGARFTLAAPLRSAARS